MHPVATIWRSRAAAEGSVHAYAVRIQRDLAALDPSQAVVDLAARMVDDEARHVEVCLDVAARFDGQQGARPAPRGGVDLVDDAPAALQPLLRLFGSCIGESIAAVWIDRSAADVRAPWLREVLRAHLADEVHHARIGWAHLASNRVSEDDREELGAWLPRLLDASLTAWRWFPDVWPADGFPEEGLPSHAVTFAAIDEAVDEVVLPGFARYGVAIDGVVR